MDALLDDAKNAKNQLHIRFQPRDTSHGEAVSWNVFTHGKQTENNIWIWIWKKN